MDAKFEFHFILFEVESLTLEVFCQWLDQLLLHILNQEDFEFIKFDRVVFVIIKLVEELVDICLCWLLVDTMLLEVHLEQVTDFISI